jgi:hypothetical protein
MKRHYLHRRRWPVLEMQGKLPTLYSVVAGANDVGLLIRSCWPKGQIGRYGAAVDHHTLFVQPHLHWAQNRYRPSRAWYSEGELLKVNFDIHNLHSITADTFVFDRILRPIPATPPQDLGATLDDSSYNYHRSKRRIKLG